MFDSREDVLDARIGKIIVHRNVHDLVDARLTPYIVEKRAFGIKRYCRSQKKRNGIGRQGAS